MPNACSKTSLNSVFIGTLHPFILMCNLTDTFDNCLFLHGPDSFAAPLLPYCRRRRHSRGHSHGHSHGHSRRHSQPGPSDRGRAQGVDAGVSFFERGLHKSLPTVVKKTGKKPRIYTNCYPPWVRKEVNTREFTRIVTHGGEENG